MTEYLQFLAKLEHLSPKTKGSDYLLTSDLSEDDLKAVFYVARALQEMHKSNISTRVFDSGVAVSIFRDQSTRTRASFFSAASMLGLSVLDFDESKSQVKHGETTRESASMLSFLTEVIGIRDDLFLDEGHEYQVEVVNSVRQSHEQGVLAQQPTVVNLQCDRDHPTQSMSDLIQLASVFGGLEKLRGKKVVMSWAFSPSYGKPQSVAGGIVSLLPRLGIDVVLAHPEGYELRDDILEHARRFAESSGSSFTVTNSMEEAFAGADVVYPKSWAPTHILRERTKLVRQGAADKAVMDKLEHDCIEHNMKFRDWACTEDMMKLTTRNANGTTKGEAVYMHCLPADITGVSCEFGEVDASVFERHRLNTYHEASHKPFVIAAAILLGRFENVPALLRNMVKSHVPRLVSASGVDERKKQSAASSATVSSTTDNEPSDIFRGIQWPEEDQVGEESGKLDAEIARLARKYKPLAVEILREAVRIAEDHIADDPSCGMSNHEGPRVEYLRRMIIEHKAVESPDDCFFNDFGALVWVVQDKDDGVAPEKKRVIFFDGHTDTVNALPEEWKRKIGSGIDAYRGLTNADEVSEEFLQKELGCLPPRSEWKHLLFGRGCADQLNGVVSQIIATKIMLELKHLGALRGVVVRSYGTVAEEDNDGGAPMHVMRKLLVDMPHMIPDVVIHTEPTSDARKGPLGIYIGQRGRMQILMEIVGTSCHGSMPWEGKNALEYGGAILKEAHEKYEQGIGFLSDAFLGAGTRTASWCEVSTPSTCAVPASFRIRWDRRLTVGETPSQALRDIRDLESVKAAIRDGLEVRVNVPHYTALTWKGYQADNEEMYIGWLTPPRHQAVQTAYAAYKRVISHNLLSNIVDGDDSKDCGDSVTSAHRPPMQPRVDRWIFSTDGVGYPMLKQNMPFEVPKDKCWVHTDAYSHPAQIGFGLGIEQVCHKLGEFVDTRLFPYSIGFCARFPSLYAQRSSSPQ